MEAEFRRFIESERFPCVGAKSALVRDNIDIITLGRVDRADCDRRLHRELRSYGERLEFDSPLVQSFAVIFDQPFQLSEADFEAALWTRLQALHDIDVELGTPWVGDTDKDPSSAHFSMSLAGEAYFVIGLHPGASRPARRFKYPVMVFNSHEQFERLRADGRFEAMKNVIRANDYELAGSINPMLKDYGLGAEAAQYSGRMVGPGWTPPFEPNRAGCPVDHDS